MEAEEKLVERVARAIWDSHELADFSVAPSIEKGFHLNGARAAIEASGLLPLLSAAEAFIAEAESMGWGETSETALPGSWDTLVKAVREVKG